MCGFLLTTIKDCFPSYSLKHLALRGPDKTYHHADPKSGYQCHFFRLGLIGGEDDAAQPKTNDEYIMVFNGEIYNHRVLRQEYNLPPSNSDTDTCWQLINKIGFKNAVPLFDGMFAITVIEKSSGVAFAAIDKFGQKPLFFSMFKGSRTFSSSLRTIVMLLQQSFQDLDARDIFDYLTFGYFPNDATPFKDIKKVMPGHILEILPSGQVTQNRYALPKVQKEQIDPFVWQGKLQTALDDSVRQTAQHSTIEEMAVSFSGGLDSSLVAGSLIRQGFNLKAITVSFPEFSKFDEAPRAKSIYSALGGNNLLTVEIKSTEMEEACLSVFDVLDIPIADASLAATQFVYKAAKQNNIKYVLGGDGADELFLGYPNIIAHQISPYVRWANVFTPEKTLERLEKIPTKSDFPFFRNLAAFIRGNRYSEPKHRHFAWPQFNKDLVDGTFECLPNRVDSMLQNLSVGDVSEYSLDMYTYLPHDILSKVDMASMGWGVEARSPFLNKSFTNKAFSFQQQSDLRRFVGKKVLKQIALDTYGIDFTKIKKHGFGFPFKEFLKSKSVQATVAEQITFCRKHGFFWNSHFEKLNQQTLSNLEVSRDFWSIFILNGFLMRLFKW